MCDKKTNQTASESHEIIQTDEGGLIKSWTKGVPFEDEARSQVKKLAGLPFIHKWVSIMPDVHAGRGATIGSVIPTVGAIIPAAVGVDIGCGMMAQKTSLQEKLWIVFGCASKLGAGIGTANPLVIACAVSDGIVLYKSGWKLNEPNKKRKLKKQKIKILKWRNENQKI